MLEFLKRFNLKILQRREFLKRQLLAFLSDLYKKSRLEEISFFFDYLLHDYGTQQFSPLLAKKNFVTLMQAKTSDFLDSTKEGELILLKEANSKKRYRIKNLLLLGAPQSRVERVLFYSFLTQTLEIYNPFDPKILPTFLVRKISLFERLLKKTEWINGKRWNQEEIRFHVEIFKRNSLLQYKIIQNIHEAYHKQRKPRLIEEGQKAMDRGISPILVTEGASGSYWIRNQNRKIIGLFKPFDEEIHAPNNPVGRRYQGALGKRKTRSGIRVGEAAHHEVAAYLIDEFLGFGIVPKTYYASFTDSAFFLVREDPYASKKAKKTKYGSFQEFVEGFHAISRLSPKEYGQISLEEFQLLAVLDVIIGNTDRNTGNLLVAGNKIAAIDHALSFPDLISPLTLWYWDYFKQADKLLFPSLLNLLQNFPEEELFWKLKKRCHISEPSLQRMRERIALFTEGAASGLPLKKLSGLLTDGYLLPLLDRKETLHEEAKNQLKLYQIALEKPKEEEDYL